MNAPRKRLLIRPGAIGDFVVSLPALQHLKAPYTEIWLSLIHIYLDVPLVGVGLLYQHGYFRQFLNADGWQQERIPALSLIHI